MAHFHHTRVQSLHANTALWAKSAEIGAESALDLSDQRSGAGDDGRDINPARQSAVIMVTALSQP